MCANNCNDDCGCTKSSEIKYSSQIIYDGEKLDLPNSEILIQKCDSLNDIIAQLANKIEELNTP